MKVEHIFMKQSKFTCKTSHIKASRSFLGLFLLCVLIFSPGCTMTSVNQNESDSEFKNSEFPDQLELQEKTQIIDVEPDKLNDHSQDQQSDKTPLNEDILDLISYELNLNHHEKEPAVKYQIDWLLSNPVYLKNVLQKSEPYIHYIHKKIKQNDFPSELTLLPVIESAYDPLAYSQSHASGLWQFIPSTAKYLGLERSLWFDARRDVVESTNVAIDYLKYLNQRFSNDWLLTLAAYNGGEGTLSKAIQKNKQNSKNTQFWGLELPTETENYVPKLLALAYVIKNKDKLGLNLPSIPNKPVFEIIELNQQIEISTIIETAGIQYNTFTKFNPGYRRSVTPPNRTSNILLPAHAAELFKEFISLEDTNNWLPFSEYQIERGDTLSRIAADHDSSIALIKARNNLQSEILKIGKILQIPHNRGTPITSKRLMSTQIVSHEILPGDTLSEIAESYKTSVKNIMLQNGLASANIKAGELLQIQIQTSKVEQRHERRIFYKVKPGDSLYLIAERFSISVKQIKQMNSVANAKYIHPGQTLVLVVDAMRI